MKRSMLFVGVLFLTSFMTLTTTAFGYEKPVCSIRTKPIFQRGHVITVTELFIGGQTVAAFYDGKKAVHAGLEYKRLGLCTVKRKSQPLCFVKEHNVDNLYYRDSRLEGYALMIDEDSLGPKEVQTYRVREFAVNAVLDRQKRGQCSIIR